MMKEREPVYISIFTVSLLKHLHFVFLIKKAIFIKTLKMQVGLPSQIEEEMQLQ